MYMEPPTAKKNFNLKLFNDPTHLYLVATHPKEAPIMLNLNLSTSVRLLFYCLDLHY
jgi:hypothetical protein